MLNIKPDVFLRIMRLKGTKKKLGLSFDEKTLQPKTTLPKQTFNKAIELITTAAFVTKKINTRSQFKDVPGLEELLDKKSTVSKKLLKEQISLFPLNSPKDSSKESYSKDDDSKKNVVNTTNQASKKQIKSTKSIQKPIESPPIFFENLKCTVSKNDEYGNGILITANEIKNISKPTHLKQFPVATALLLRTLLEQTLKYHIKKMNKWDDLTKKGKNQDPGLQSIINFYNQHLKDLIPDSTYQRTFKGVFSNTGIKDSLDLVVHHTDLVRIDNQILKSLASAGLRAIIEYILTYNYQKNPGQN